VIEGETRIVNGVSIVITMIVTTMTATTMTATVIGGRGSRERAAIQLAATHQRYRRFSRGGPQALPSSRQQRQFSISVDCRELGNRIYMVATRMPDEAQKEIAEHRIAAYQKYVGPEPLTGGKPTD